MEPKKLVKIVLVVIVGAIAVWQAISLFSGPDEAAQAAAVKAAQPVIHPDAPKSAALIPPPQPKPVLTEREIALMKLQEETQAKYLTALNELQVLKIEKEIAMANKDIMKAKEDTITAQTNILELLQPKPTVTAAAPPPSVPPNIAGGPPSSMPGGPTSEPSHYSIVSITNLRGRWTAVINTGDKLISVSMGDTIVDDGSKVISIDKSGVTLDKQGVKSKIAMASII